MLDIIRKNGTFKAKKYPEHHTVLITPQLWDYFQNTAPVLLRERSVGSNGLKMSRKPRKSANKNPKKLTVDFSNGKVHEKKT